MAARAESRVGVKDLTGVVLEKDTVAGKALQGLSSVRYFYRIIQPLPQRPYRRRQTADSLAIGLGVISGSPFAGRGRLAFRRCVLPFDQRAPCPSDRARSDAR
jgi:hypothetical protein